MSKSVRMTRSELVWETRVAYFDEKRWNETLAWLQTFADKELDPLQWDGRWAIVYHRVKGMSFADILGYIEGYHDSSVDNIIFTFKAKNYNGEEWEYHESLYDLIMDWLRDDCIESEVWDWNYADDSEERIEVVDLHD